MIQHTFSILQGIGEKTERRLWHQGILTWDDFLKAASLDVISPESKRLHDESLLEARKHLCKSDSDYFARMLKPAEHWRLFNDFQDYAVALDIETNGLMPQNGGCVTMVGLYDGFDYRALVTGAGLSRDNLQKELGRYRLLLTYYGSVFDLPFLRATLGATFTGAHFDLCFGCRRAGLTGGLKRVEQQLGISREETVTGLDGFDAVRLWHEARQGSEDALELLIAYNRCDTVNLVEIAGIIYERLKHRTGITALLGS